MWQKKAWYDAATCNRWIAQYAIHEVPKADLGRGQRHLILCDNLAGQTRKSNPMFMKLLAQHCDADVFNLVAGDLQPASCDLRPASCDLRPASCFVRPASCDLLPASCDLLPASYDLLRASCDLLPASFELP